MKGLGRCAPAALDSDYRCAAGSGEAGNLFVMEIKECMNCWSREVFEF